MNRLLLLTLATAISSAAALAVGLVTLSRWFAEAIEDGFEESA